METDRLIQLALAVAALIAFVFVLWARVTSIPHPPDDTDEIVVRRFIFIDALLIVAGIELVTDAFRDVEGFGTIVEVVTFLCRGMLVAGGLALALSMRAERTRRRVTRVLGQG